MVASTAIFMLSASSCRRLLLSRATSLTGRCRSIHPTRINSDIVGRVREPCRLLQGAEGQITHDTDNHNRDARSKKCAHARLSELSWLSEAGLELLLVVESDQGLLPRLLGRVFQLNA